MWIYTLSPMIACREQTIKAPLCTGRTSGSSSRMSPCRVYYSSLAMTLTVARISMTKLKLNTGTIYLSGGDPQSFFFATAFTFFSLKRAEFNIISNLLIESDKGNQTLWALHPPGLQRYSLSCQDSTSFCLPSATPP